MEVTEMLFNEVYGTYYNIIAEILGKAVEGQLTRQEIYEIVREKGFEESVLTIPQNLTDGTWPLLREDLTTPLRHRPTMPLTLLEKRWLKTLLSDPRIRLFDPPLEGLENVEPLYAPDTFVYYDRYLDGDPYDDPRYIENFRTILRAIREKRWITVRYRGRQNRKHYLRCIPYHMEYSSKDDKFRVVTRGNHGSPMMINLARIISCKLLDACLEEEYRPRRLKKTALVLELTDERNALERVMLHFSHLDKETERIDDRRYRITLRYEKEDETELLIRVLSFGPVLKVVSPDDFIGKLKERLHKQMKLRAQN